MPWGGVSGATVSSGLLPCSLPHMGLEQALMYLPRASTGVTKLQCWVHGPVAEAGAYV